MTGVRSRKNFVSSRIVLTVGRVTTFIDQAKRNVKLPLASRNPAGYSRFRLHSRRNGVIDVVTR